MSLEDVSKPLNRGTGVSPVTKKLLYSRHRRDADATMNYRIWSFETDSFRDQFPISPPRDGSHHSVKNMRGGRFASPDTIPIVEVLFFGFRGFCEVCQASLQSAVVCVWEEFQMVGSDSPLVISPFKLAVGCVTA